MATTSQIAYFPEVLYSPNSILIITWLCLWNCLLGKHKLVLRICTWTQTLPELLLVKYFRVYLRWSTAEGMVMTALCMPALASRCSSLGGLFSAPGMLFSRDISLPRPPSSWRFPSHSSCGRRTVFSFQVIFVYSLLLFGGVRPPGASSETLYERFKKRDRDLRPGPCIFKKSFFSLHIRQIFCLDRGLYVCFW